MIHPTAVDLTLLLPPSHPGTLIGEGARSRPARSSASRRSSRAPRRPRAELPPLEIGAGSVICAQAIVFAGARLGEGVIVGDQAFVRERVTIGAGSVVGRGSTVENDTSIGARVKIQTQVYVTAYMTIEDDVFVGPGVTTTNDDTMSRHDARYALRGPCCAARAAWAAA